MKRIALSSLALLATVNAACGSVSDGKNAQSLAVLHGELTNQSNVSLQNPGATRVAVIWGGKEPNATRGFRVAIDLPVQPKFPSQFEIQLTDPPPASAMVTESAVADDEPPVTPTEPTTGTGGVKPLNNASTPSTMTFAIGTVVAYEDVNGNGKLDLVSDDATQFVDRIVGSNSTLGLLYYEGAITPQIAAYGVAKGYNIFSYTSCEGNVDQTGAGGSFTNGANGSGDVPSTPPPTGNGIKQSGLKPQGGGTSTSGESCSDGPKFYPMTKLFELPLSNDPHANTLMCNSDKTFGGSEAPIASQPVPDPDAPSSGSNKSSGSNNGKSDFNTNPPPGGYPSATDPNLHCWSDGSGFVLGGACTTYGGGICKDEISECSAGVPYSRPTPVPATWPCADNSGTPDVPPSTGGTGTK